MTGAWTPDGGWGDVDPETAKRLQTEAVARITGKTPRNTPRGLFPMAGAFGRHVARRFQCTGEFRAPRKGEHYLSGAIPEVFATGYDLTTPYWIAREVRVDMRELLRRAADALADYEAEQGNPRSALRAEIEVALEVPHG